MSRINSMLSCVDHEKKSLIVNNLFQFYVLKPHCRVILNTVIYGTYYVLLSVASRIALCVLPFGQCYPIAKSLATLAINTNARKMIFEQFRNTKPNRLPLKYLIFE